MRETMSARVRRGEARGQRRGGPIPLKWRLRQTSSDKVVLFLCPSPRPDNNTAPLCSKGRASRGGTVGATGTRNKQAQEYLPATRKERKQNKKQEEKGVGRRDRSRLRGVWEKVRKTQGRVRCFRRASGCLLSSSSSSLLPPLLPL